MHTLLARQLRHAGVSPDALSDELRHLLDLVDEAYREADADRALADRSLELTSQELLERQRQLQAELSARLHTESALRSSEERYRLLFDASPLNILVFATDTLRIVECNAAAVKFYGYSRGELLKMKLTDLKAEPHDPELRSISRGPTELWRGTKAHRRKDGTLAEVAVTAHGLRLDGRDVVLTMGVDVTETRHLEERLRQSQKMEGVGLLAGGIAHDFNNMMAAVLSYADLAADGLEPTHPVKEDIKEISKAARRAATLTQQLLAFSRKQPAQPRVVTLNAVVAAMDRMLRRVIREDIEVSVEVEAAPWSVRVDPSHMEQVLLNLVVNARDSMPNGGKLTIATRNEYVSEAEARQLEIAPGQHVVLAVGDTGCGMDPATRARIFEPFYTTKGLGKGTGLGLATVFGIVKQSGGGISVQSEPGRGSEFVVYLPRTGAPNDARISVLPISSGGVGTETVLVVEDDPQVQAVTCRVLAARGYRVLPAEGPREALEMLHRGDTSVSVLLTDVVMPDIDGRTLASRAVAVRPQLRVVFMSGYTEHPLVDHVPFGPDEHFIRKPFTPHELVRGVRQALDGTDEFRMASGDRARTG